MDYDSEYRRQCCRERVERISDEYRRVQRPPRDERRDPVVVQMRSIWHRVRRQVPQRVPA
ncbi:MAG: hypothetical protein ACTHNB_12195 [Gaiellaceae bacterium]